MATELLISVPEVGEVEVGGFKIVPITITNNSDLDIKKINIEVGGDSDQMELFGIIPNILKGGESFDLELTVKPTVFNPDGINGTLTATALQVSR